MRLSFSSGLPLELVFLLVCSFWSASSATHHAHRRCIKNTSNSTIKIAVAIAGVSRGLHYTLRTIERHVFDVLSRNNFQTDVYWSSVSIPDFFGHSINEFEMQEIRPCAFSIISQEAVMDFEFERFCRLRRFVCDKGVVREAPDLAASKQKSFRTHSRELMQFKNYLCAFETQSRMARIIKSHSKIHGFEYDAIMMIRPDVAFIRDTDLPSYIEIVASSPNTIWIPDFQPFGGLNDRAAFGNHKVMLQYLERGDIFMSNASYGVMIAEQYLKTFLDNLKIEVKPSSMRFLRIRPMEDNGTDVGIVDGFDVNPKHLNVAKNDPDLLRCVGSDWFTHTQMNFQYKPINSDFC